MLSRAGVRVVGLTGGMGAGKSTVAALLAAHGADVVDADAIAREVVEPGTPGLAAIVDRFGADVLTDDGRLDRAALAAIVFDDPDALADLEAITHPAIRAAIDDRLDELATTADRGSDDVVAVVDHPLLVETGLHEGVDLVVVVEAPVSLRLDRLERHRGVDRADARSRMEQQAGDGERRAVADVVLVNDGDEAALAREIAAAWPTIAGRSGG